MKQIIKHSIQHTQLTPGSLAYWSNCGFAPAFNMNSLGRSTVEIRSRVREGWDD
jgi:hypothetical protein